jgi:cytochrome c oxidase subunit 2
LVSFLGPTQIYSLQGETRLKTRNTITFILIGIFLIIIGYLVATTIDVSAILPIQASSSAVQIDRLFRVMLGIATAIFLLVEGGLIYAIFRFRRKRDDTGDGAPLHGNTLLEIIWTIIPAIIVVVISLYSYQVLTEIERPGVKPLVIEVIGKQFAWEFRYPQEEVTTTSLHLPIDREINLQITSEDVIHSFWVPEFRIKRDATPGEISELILRPTEPGTYRVLCAELCGPGHAAMIAEVVIESKEEFDDWIETQSNLADLPFSSPEGRRALFTTQACGSCHTLSDANAIGIVGPSLEEIGTIAGERVPGLDSQNYITQSILEPDAYVLEGYTSNLMPNNYGERLTAEELQALVEYLLEQQ